jgi:MFS family permease
VAEGSFANGIGTMSGGVIVSGILKYLGASDAVNGIISGIPVSAGILLILVPLAFRNITHVKRTVTLFAVIHRLLFALMLSVPLIVQNNATRLIAFVVIYASGYMIGTFIGPSASNWLISLVPARIRGRYLGIREGTMIASMTVVSVAIGLVVDHMKAIGNEALGYGICTAVIFVFTVGNFLCLLNIKEPPPAPVRNKITFKKILTAPIKNKNFRKIILLSAFWNFSLQIGGPYFSIYFYSVLGLNYTYIMIMNVLMYTLRVFAAQFWGRLADRKNWVYVTKLSLICLGITHAGFIFMNENTYTLVYPLLQAMSGIGWGGVAISMFNLQFEYAPEENRTSYISLNTSVGSIVGFAAILIASVVVNKIGGNTVYISSFPIHGMQFLLLASGVLIIFTSFFVHKFIKPEKNG